MTRFCRGLFKYENKNWFRKLMYNCVVHSDEIPYRKRWHLGMDPVQFVIHHHCHFHIESCLICPHMFLLFCKFYVYLQGASSCWCWWFLVLRWLEVELDIDALCEENVYTTVISLLVTIFNKNLLVFNWGGC